LVIAAVEPGRVDQSVTVFHVEKVARHFQLPGTYRNATPIDRQPFQNAER
jgi:hypothetical protein